MIGIILVAHGQFASALLDAAESIIGKQDDIVAIDVSKSLSPAEIESKVDQALSDLEARSDGVMIMTDLFGGSSCNVCLAATRGKNARVLTGLCMPMVLKALSYRKISELDDLAEKVCEAGRSGIVNASRKMENACLNQNR